MIYRVVLKISYHERWFDFSNIVEASDFAKTVLDHSVINEDNAKKPTYITIKVMTQEEAYKIAEEEE